MEERGGRKDGRRKLEEELWKEREKIKTNKMECKKEREEMKRQNGSGGRR